MLLTALSALTKPRNPMDDPAGTRTPARQRADAFAEILRRYLDSGEARSKAANDHTSRYT